MKTTKNQLLKYYFQNKNNHYKNPGIKHLMSGFLHTTVIYSILLTELTSQLYFKIIYYLEIRPHQ